MQHVHALFDVAAGNPAYLFMASSCSLSYCIFWNSSGVEFLYIEVVERH